VGGKCVAPLVPAAFGEFEQEFFLAVEVAPDGGGVQARGFGDGREGDVADAALLGGECAGGVEEVFGATKLGLL
jgi:hypothetical protein